MSDINESIIFLGDIFQSGDVEIQVSQPRIPCHKLNKIFGRKDVVREVQRLGYTGFYFRVLKPGNIQKGDTFTFIRRLDKSVSIAETNYLLRGKKKNIKRIQQVLNLDFVSEDYKKDLRKIL